MNLQYQAAAASAATRPKSHDNPASRNTPSGAGAPQNPARLQIRGVTLIELLVVLAIIAIVAGFAIPSFLGLVAGTHISTTVNAFLADNRYARGEAIRRGKTVTICRSANPAAHPPKCSNGTGMTVGGWKEGWFVFADEDGDGTFDSGADTVLLIQEGFANVGHFLAVNNAGSPVNNRNYITYDASGRAVGLQSRWLVNATGSLGNNGSYTRTLCMNFVGRLRIQAGDVQCA